MKPGKSFLLDTSDSYDEFFEDSCLIGLVTSVKSYKFCLQVNKLLNFDFRLNTDIEIILNKKNRNYYFPVYQSNVKHSFTKHYLYSNRNDGEILLPEFKNIDFIWLIKGEANIHEQFGNLLSLVKSIQDIQLATEIDYTYLGNRENLIF